jgi:hypothetical protein
MMELMLETTEVTLVETMVEMMVVLVNEPL